MVPNPRPWSYLNRKYQERFGHLTSGEGQPSWYRGTISGPEKPDPANYRPSSVATAARVRLGIFALPSGGGVDPFRPRFATKASYPRGGVLRITQTRYLCARLAATYLAHSVVSPRRETPKRATHTARGSRMLASACLDGPWIERSFGRRGVEIVFCGGFYQGGYATTRSRTRPLPRRLDGQKGWACKP